MGFRELIKWMFTLGIGISFLYSLYNSVFAPSYDYLYYIPYFGIYYYAVDMSRAWDQFFALISAMCIIGMFLILFWSSKRNKRLDNLERRLYPDG